MLATLCVGDLGVIGVQPDFALGSDIGRNKLNFGYGVNFKYNGEIHTNLDRVWVVQRFNLPKGLTSYFTGMKFGPNCEYSNLRPLYTDKAWAIDSLSRINFIKDVCRQTRPMLAQLEKGAITMFKQATKASATPTGLPPSRVICHDPWVSLVLTCLTVCRNIGLYLQTWQTVVFDLWS